MRGFALAAGILSILAPHVIADEAAGPRSDNAVYLRLLVGIGKPLLVTGYLDETKGTGQGYDAAFLDLDGNGTFETRQDFPPYTLPNTGEERPDPKVTIRHEDCDWVLDLRYTRFTPVDGVARAYIRWTVTRGEEFYAWFINGQVSFYTELTAAAAADPIRLGPPFEFQTGTRTRGREGLITVGLKDSNGCTLRLARRDKAIVSPALTLSQDGNEVLQTQASYG
jgi:hypothetical protein